MINSLNRLFSFRPLKYGCILGMLVFLLAVFVPSKSFFARSLVEYASQGVIFFLFFGLFFYIINQKWLMYVALFTSAIVSLHLKNSTNQTLKLNTADPTVPGVSVSVLDLNNSVNDYPALHKTLSESKVEVVALQDLPRGIIQRLMNDFSQKYPFHSFYDKKGNLGIGFLSTLEIVNIDTLFFNRLPNLKACLRFQNGKCVNIVNTRPTTKNSNESYDIHHYLSKMKSWLSDKSIPNICLGNLNTVPWDIEFVRFKNNSHLKDSNRSLLHLDGSPSIDFLYKPLIHILHSEELECTDFQRISPDDNSQIKGVRGNYQIKLSDEPDELLSAF